MKIKKENIKKSLLEELRDIRNRVSMDIEDMNYEELVEYLRNKKPLHPKLK